MQITIDFNILIIIDIEKKKEKCYNTQYYSY